MSKETREKMGRVCQATRNLLNALPSDTPPYLTETAAELRTALNEFEEHLYGTVADVIKQELTGSPVVEEATEGLFVTDADGIPEPDGSDGPLQAAAPQVSDPDPEPVDPDDEVPF